MSSFDINLDKVRENIKITDDIAKQYGQYIDSIKSINQFIKSNSAFQDIAKRLDAFDTEAREEKDNLYGLKKALEEICVCYEQTENKLLNQERGKSSTKNEENKGVKDPIKELLSHFMDFVNNSGCWVSGTAEGLKEVANWAKPFLEAGFKIKIDGKYIAVIFGSNQIKKLLGFRHRYKLSDIGKCKEIDELFKFNKMLKVGKFADDLGKLGNKLAVLGIGLDVASGVYENYNKGASASEYVGDVVVDTAVGAGGFYAAVAATEAGAGAGASVGGAVGTAICPGVGTVIGGVAGGIVGGVSGAFAGTKLYNKVVSGDCFGLLPEGESIEQYAKDGCQVVCDKIGEGVSYVGDKIGDALGNLSLGW